jgi:hypothetical protein
MLSSVASNCRRLMDVQKAFQIAPFTHSAWLRRRSKIFHTIAVSQCTHGFVESHRKYRLTGCLEQRMQYSEGGSIASDGDNAVGLRHLVLPIRSDELLQGLPCGILRKTDMDFQIYWRYLTDPVAVESSATESVIHSVTLPLLQSSFLVSELLSSSAK